MRHDEAQRGEQSGLNPDSAGAVPSQTEITHGKRRVGGRVGEEREKYEIVGDASSEAKECI